jgi:hypothetical protein
MLGQDPEALARSAWAEKVAWKHFGDLFVARHWLELELDELEGRRPIDVASEDEGGLFRVIQIMTACGMDGDYTPTGVETASFRSYEDRIQVVAPNHAPADFTPGEVPPKSPTLELWWIMDFPECRCQAFYGLVLGHPHLGHSSTFRSSALIWYDENFGFARTQSRFYRLGAKAERPWSIPLWRS